MMPVLDVTPEEIAEAVRGVYGEKPEHAPSHLFLCHYHDYHTFLRVAFPGGFCGKCATRLYVLLHRLKRRHCPTCDVTVVITFEPLDEDEVMLRTLALNADV